MNSISVFIFRVLLVIGGIVLIYIVGKPTLDNIKYRFTGNIVEGRVIGFRGSRTSTTVFEDNTGRKGKHHRSRRPVYRYPIAIGSLDSLDGFAKSTILIPWFNFEMDEKVTVVMDKIEPSKSHIWSFGILLTDMILLALCAFMIKLGITKNN
jgi:hypothetical protein